jgi:hypothetical protein
VSTTRDATTPSRYDLWNRALAGRFFTPEHKGRPVYLQVDDETLAELAPVAGVPGDQAEDDFTRAVRHKLKRGPLDPDLFWEFWLDLRAWKRSSQHELAPPPFIALLGLCVLAASHMHRDATAGIASHNYYARLNDLLGLRTEGQPPDFDQVTGFWLELNQWLSEDHHGQLVDRPAYEQPYQAAS